MNGEALIEYGGVRRIEGPLVVVDGVEGVGWDEAVRIRLESGEVRHGVVLEVDRGTAVVQVLEGTEGIGLRGTRVIFEGGPFRVPLGDGWLGRVCNGRGDPIDGGPPVTGATLADVNGAPINPTARETPRDPILTGVAVIDALLTLVRGQKLPVFSLGGLPHLELAAQIASQAHVGDEPFAAIFAAMGLTHADAAAVRNSLEARSSSGELAVFLNTADDPVIERILTPRVALTVAEHLAFEGARHVLVVMADMTSYCEAVRQVGAARGEIPGRRAYPAYLYSDLASLYERCGRIRGRPGSITEVPVLTMPAGDITHPVPDLTGYITEGQIVLSAEIHARGVYPPVDPLASLSRLMRRGAGPGRTREDHLDLAAQLLALLARAREVSELAELLGSASLSPTERIYLSFADAFYADFVHQGADQSCSLEESLGRAWKVASLLPRRELTSLSEKEIERWYVAEASDPAGGPGREANRPFDDDGGRDGASPSAGASGPPVAR
jgi:V/A-type H+-transporting ATPase subunit B